MKNEIGLTREVEEIWNPQCIKQVPGTGFLLVMVLSQINELQFMQHKNSNVGSSYLNTYGHHYYLTSKCE
jgi:hypothetical protein